MRESVRFAGREVSVVLVSHETRGGVLAETLDHLQSVGVEPHVQETSGKPESRNVRLGVRDALAAVPWRDGVLVMEDDVRFRRDWRVVMEVVVTSDFPTVCCTLPLECIPRPWSDLIRNGKPKTVRPRAVPMVRPLAFYGAQLVYLPAWSLELLWREDRLHDRTDRLRGMSFDGFLNNVMQDNPDRVGLQVAIPDVADHLSPESVLDPRRKPRKPHMFHWEADWDAP